MAVRILKTFTGYPGQSHNDDGSIVSGPRREFIAGRIVDDLSADYAALIVAKGLAEPIAAPPQKSAAGE